MTELPSLTVLYNPEQSALELTSDCGLDGTKRIACKGNVVSVKYWELEGNKLEPFSFEATNVFFLSSVKRKSVFRVFLDVKI